MSSIMLGAGQSSASPSICSLPSEASVSNSEGTNTPGTSQASSIMADEGATNKALTAPKPNPQISQTKGKEKEKRTLIDLPVDVLKDIVKEVNNTNDLVSLSLTCRCLHTLSIPHIYSRFDIVWPDTTAAGDRAGVDALTYGLATLVASGPRGNDYARWVRKFSLGNGPENWVSEYNIEKEGGKMLGTLVTLAITRMQNLETFSWDMPTGVLRDVFMALHDLCPQSLRNVHVRFHNNTNSEQPISQDPSRRVETPTFKGFSALRSLSVLDIDERQYLEEMSYAIEKSLTTLRELRLGLARHIQSRGRWIWDTDEIPAPDDDMLLTEKNSAVGGVLGILVSRFCELAEKKKKAPELRPPVIDGYTAPIVDMHTPHYAAPSPFQAVMQQQQHDSQQPANPQPTGAENTQDNLIPPATDPTVNVENETGEGLASMSLDQSFNSPAAATGQTFVLYDTTGDESAQGPTYIPLLSPNIIEVAPSPPPEVSTMAQPIGVVSPPAPLTASPGSDLSAALPLPLSTVAQVPVAKVVSSIMEEDERPIRQLKLETLEFERVPLSIRVLQRAIDWTVLQSLTILNCHNHVKLWKALRKKFCPYSLLSTGQSAYLKPGFPAYHPLKPTASAKGKNISTASASTTPTTNDYRIRLRKIHTDRVSSSLMNFIKETLPPNSLEVLILQENPEHKDQWNSEVTMETIFKGCIKRHKSSLKKLLVDANCNCATYESDKWRFDKDVLSFVTSGKMENLRELGFAIDYKDWHFFLQRLPMIYQLRSLYIPYVKASVHLQQSTAKELAQQIVTIVTLRPEVEICYVGIQNKCFELLEGSGTADSEDQDEVNESEGDENLDPNEDEDEDEDDEDEEMDEDDEEEEEEEVEVMDDEEDEDGEGENEAVETLVNSGAGSADSSAPVANASKHEGGEGGGKKGKDGGPKVRLREILFYEDKVAVFKARNGKL